MVKTIKKRHSISEIEGSSNTLPPQVYQKILEKHHKNFLEQQNNSQPSTPTQLQPQMQPQTQPHPQPQQQPQMTTKLNKITEEKTQDVLKSFNSSGSDHLLSFDSNSSPNTTITSNDSKQPQTKASPTVTNDNGSQNKASSFLTSFMPRDHNYMNVTSLENVTMPELAEMSMNVAHAAPTTNGTPPVRLG